ncbi:hypothetical protein [Eisenibacter elegans]|uniref:hypothetical protein n=1 Tax=Eisenibacter elegans TaxID=997 RepID=UPI00041ED4EE|nr:hypothetical protein [Eisenibacter elegans]
MTDYLFNTDGSLASTRPGSNKAFIGNQEVPFISAADLVTYAAIIYSESASQGLVTQITGGANVEREMARETYGMARAMFNYTIKKNQALQRANRGSYGLKQLLTDANYAKGKGTPIYQEYYTTGGDHLRRKLSTLAVIKIFTRNEGDVADIANSDIVGWDGRDVFTRYQAHYRFQTGLELGNPAHGQLYSRLGIQTIATGAASNPNVIAAGRKYTWLSVFTAGGSIFYALHPQAVAQGISV